MRFGSEDDNIRKKLKQFDGQKEISEKKWKQESC